MACQGLNLMEVFNILYLGHDKIERENQSGTIKIISNNGEQYLYNVPYEDIQDVDMSKPTLTFRDNIVVSVKAPTCSFEELDINFDLFSGSGTYKGTLKVEWDSMELFYHQILCMDRRIRSVDGTGEIAVRLGLFANATVANLKVSLLNQFATVNVSGVVVASNSKLDHQPSCTSVLFVKKNTSTIQLGDDGAIPLSKSRVGVPLDSLLHVDISLVVNGVRETASVSFKAEAAGKATAIDPQNPMFQVQVNWDAKEDSARVEYDTTYDAYRSDLGPLYETWESMKIDSDCSVV